MAFNSSEFVESAKKQISNELVGRGILACSGGQDSTLLAVIANEAAGDRILSVFIDTGLLREGEVDSVRKTFSSFSINFRVIDASEEFVSALRGVTDPEQKRKIVGNKFIEIFERVAAEYGANTLLQGTIAPDWIESGGKIRDVIKSHHNVGGLPEKMKLKLLEPLRDLYKDEIREVSRFLNIPRIIQPFPGPGLSVRIMGEVTKERLELLRKTTKIVETSIEKWYAGSDDLPWQFFAVLLPIRTTGIHGDKRTYGYTVAIRAVDTLDAMSGTFSRLPYDLLDSMSTSITNEVKEINRVVFDVTNKPPGTIEWE
ncbi:MAG: glutamine-hydrolyzing GMP synthase [Candidatus Thermoplasmatota archaeon]|jgi:GMP synthase (glutamine-hydrolysing)|nr:glutamine-hydrolyzing GMP synthase [Candidatus Thermoplasmatota archaeon]MCL5667711.1 glutamine-hydrolyzing GMP synthase [Candidatus Thermoplasmatota archaeon]